MTMNSMQRMEDRIHYEIDQYKKLHYRLAKRLSNISIQPVNEVLIATVKNGKRVLPLIPASYFCLWNVTAFPDHYEKPFLFIYILFPAP